MVRLKVKLVGAYLFAEHHPSCLYDICDEPQDPQQHHHETQPGYDEACIGLDAVHHHAWTHTTAQHSTARHSTQWFTSPSSKACRHHSNRRRKKSSLGQKSGTGCNCCHCCIAPAVLSTGPRYGVQLLPAGTAWLLLLLLHALTCTQQQWC
jgi:hypothetical protein